MDTISGNKLIAEFMGSTILCDGSVHTCIIYKKDGYKFPDGTNGRASLEKLEYHTSWDWLMPVIDKIASLGYIVERIDHPKYVSCRIYRADDKVDSCKLIINDAVYKSVIQFIQWYNLKFK